MALIRCNFFAETLELSTSMTVLLPQPTTAQIGVTRVFADRTVRGSGEDLLHLVATADPSRLPRLMLRCGTEDHTLAQNQRFVAACRKHGVALDADFGPGAHEWGYWDAQIQDVLEFLRPDKS